MATFPNVPPRLNTKYFLERIQVFSNLKYQIITYSEISISIVGGFGKSNYVT